jgi:hypothetical protein
VCVPSPVLVLTVTAPHPVIGAPPSVKVAGPASGTGLTVAV